MVHVAHTFYIVAVWLTLSFIRLNCMVKCRDLLFNTVKLVFKLVGLKDDLDIY